MTETSGTGSNATSLTGATDEAEHCPSFIPQRGPKFGALPVGAKDHTHSIASQNENGGSPESFACCKDLRFQG